MQPLPTPPAQAPSAHALTLPARQRGCGQVFCDAHQQACPPAKNRLSANRATGHTSADGQAAGSTATSRTAGHGQAILARTLRGSWSSIAALGPFLARGRPALRLLSGFIAKPVGSPTREPPNGLAQRLAKKLLPVLALPPKAALVAGLATGLLAGLALAPSGPAHAAAPDCAALPPSVLFEQRTWTEIRDGLGCGVTTVIIPVGGTEQSGPYIAVGKHNVRVMAQAERIARTVGDTLVAPVMAYVPEGGTKPRTSHMRFAGTLSIPPDVFEKLISAAAESLRVQGFTLIVLLGDHGGYQTLLGQVATTLNTAWRGTGARALYVRDYYDVLPHQYADWLKKTGHAREVGLHAELSDTALMLAVDPTMVREQALRAGPPPSAAQGIYGGDPRGASAALGQPGLDMQRRAATQAIEAARAHP